MVKVGKVYLLLAAVLLLTACPDGNLLLSGSDDDADILIQSVAEGSVIAPAKISACRWSTPPAPYRATVRRTRSGSCWSGTGLR